FFSYFWVATMFQPAQIAEDLKRNGGYIPGIRPGPPTCLFLDQTMQRLTFSGSLFLTLIFFIPSLMTVNHWVSPIVAQFFGGTSLLILVGVLLDVMRQVETTLLQRNYDGFLKKGKMRGRYNHLQGTGVAANSSLVMTMWIGISVVLIAGAIAAYVYTNY
ncbi:MAG: preprotein translocase subunit SecY, partial [Akkermansia sp.]